MRPHETPPNEDVTLVTSGVYATHVRQREEVRNVSFAPRIRIPRVELYCSRYVRRNGYESAPEGGMASTPAHRYRKS